MRKTLQCIFYVFTILSMVACARPVAGELIKSDKPRLTSPTANQNDVSAVVAGNSVFALELYRKLKTGEGNLFYSPHSISMALAMAYAGASSQTEQQIADTLHYTLSQERLHPAFNWLDNELSQRGVGAQGKDNKGFRLKVANAIWGQKDFSFQSQYLDILAQNYGAGLRILDFINTENSRITINDWVSNQTEGRIQDLVPRGAINHLTRLVLTNAIYFNAAWLHQFNKDATVEGTFHLIEGRQLTVPMMKQTATISYMKGNGYQAAELLYDGRQISMVVLLPDTGRFREFEQSLEAPQVSDTIKNLNATRVSLTMPRFEFNSQFSLKETLSAMGMPAAFTDAADFSGMTGKRDNLHISDVLHKAFVSVDETGTEAAAATAVIVGVTSIPAEPPVDFRIDRPFIFLIRDIPTGEILFVGRVLNPSMP